MTNITHTGTQVIKDIIPEEFVILVCQNKNKNIDY